MSTVHAAVEDAPVFLLGSGRCGSTLLQAVLNTNPEFMIWGEHDGFLRHFARSYFRLKTSLVAQNILSSGTFESDVERLRNTDVWNGFVNPSDVEAFTAKIRGFVRSLFADVPNPSVRWGFKEIRYGWNDRDFTPQFLRDSFPRSQFLIVVRNPVDTVFSILASWCSGIGNDVTELDRELLSTVRHWARIYERLFLFHHSSGGRSRIVRYEDFGPAEFEKVAEFLHARTPFDYRSATATVKDPCRKDDEFASLIRARTKTQFRKLNHITGQARLLYGYSEGWTGW